MPRNKKLIDTILKIVRILILVFLGIGVLLFIGKLAYDNRIVATVDGNTIYYNNSAYEEVFEVFETKTSRCLGTLEWHDKSKSKIWAIHGKPEYIYVAFFIDHRIYKIVSSE